MSQRGVADLRVLEAQHLELAQSFEVFQSGAADLGAIECQQLENGSPNPLSVEQPGVANFGVAEVQVLKLVESLECAPARRR